jgi:hypothetical protein
MSRCDLRSRPKNRYSTYSVKTFGNLVRGMSELGGQEPAPKTHKVLCLQSKGNFPKLDVAGSPSAYLAGTIYPANRLLSRRS